MTPESAHADIRDGVEWKPWYVRLAQPEGQKALVLIDGDAVPHTCEDDGLPPTIGRYQVGRTDIPGNPCWDCGLKGAYARNGERLVDTDSLTEALAAFHAAEERLIRGEL